MTRTRGRTPRGPAASPERRGARVAEWTGFENQRVLRGTGGSNPSLSAIPDPDLDLARTWPERGTRERFTTEFTKERCRSG